MDSENREGRPAVDEGVPDLFGSGLQEYLDAADSGRIAVLAAEAHPDDPIAQAEMALAQEKLRLLQYERDNAGAFKIKKLDREFQMLFDGAEGSPPRVERTASGYFVPAESERNRRFMFVDMLELDRFNKEGGGHDAGDQALIQTVGAIRAAVEAGLSGREGRQAAFKIYRSGGNQYVVSFEDLDEASFNAIQEAVGRARPSIRGDIEPAPLVVTGLNFRDVIEDLNVVQAELPESARIEGGDAAAKEMMQLMLREADWGAEVRKFSKRAERMRDKLAPADGSAPDPNAAEFFRNYVAKAFQGTSFAELDGLRAAIKDGRFDRQAREEAVSAARRRFEIGREADMVETAAADEYARDEIVKKRVAAHALGSALQPEFPRDERLASIPGRTEGESALEAKRLAMVAARAELAAARANPSLSEAEMRLLRLKTGLAEAGYRTESARRNLGTGLLERGVYFEDLEKALQEGEPVAVIFIDMGFLKYFDQKGGVDVGNDALRVAAALLERAGAELGGRAVPYRLGGDEFTVLIRGDRAQAIRFIETLDRLGAAAGKIAPGAKSKPEYVPTELQFNCGYADVEALGDILEASPRKDLTPNQKAELLTKAADLGVEYLKATSRFKYLLSQMRDPRFVESRPGLARPEDDVPPTSLSELLARPAGRNEYTRQVESKIGFSAKALFAEAGGETVLRVFADELRHTASLPEGERAEIEAEIEDTLRRFIHDRVQASHQVESGRQRVLDELLGARTVVQFYEAELRDLQSRAGVQQGRISELEKALARVERDFRDMVAARRNLYGGSEAA